MTARARAEATWQALCRIGGPVGASIFILGGLLVVVALVVGTVELGRYAASALDRNGSAAECQTEGAVGSRARGALPMAKVVLTPKSQEVTWAFDASRGRVPVPIVITASPPLTGLPPAGIEVITTPLLRADNHEQLPNKATSSTRISRNGERLFIEICVDPRGATAGRYAGSVFVGTGRPNVAGTSVDLVVTTRSPGYFGLGMFFMLVAIVVVLTLKGIADYRRAIAGTQTDGQPTEFRWRQAAFYIWSRDELRFISSLIGVGTAIFVGFRIYNTDRVWGDDAYQDSVALIAAAIAAVGAQGIFDGFLGAAKGGK